MKRALLILASIIGIAFGVLVITIIFNVYVLYPRHENQTKEFLEQKISTLPVPLTCKESKRSYTKGSLDVVSTWNVDYKCDTTGGEAYNSIVPILISRGFKANYDNSISTRDEPATSYYFAYKDKELYLTYIFMPHIDDRIAPEQLPNTRVDEIGLSITRN